MLKRVHALGEWLKQEDIDVAVVTSTDNVFYFSGFYSDPHERLLATVLFPEQEPFLICPQMEVPSARQAGFEHTVFGYSDTEDPWEIVKTEIAKRTKSVKKIAVEKTHLNVERYEIIQAAFPEATFIHAEEKLNQLRLVKDEVELQKLKKACELADYAITVGVNEIKAGVTELELVAAIEYELKKKGVEKMSFATTVLAGANAASPHGSPGSTKVQKGDFVLFDLGVVYEGYCSDITRTVAYQDVTDEQIRVYEAVLKGQEAAIAASLPGVTCAHIDTVARDIIKHAGYGDYFTHRLGHGLGISIHEYPSVTETNPLVLQKGMVYTIEPGVYIPGNIGVRIEDDVHITEQGAEVLTKYPKQLQIVK
ncbi:Xaa-Pro peptidase family protein [Caldibacillus lycopersici]|uniref:Xaa-Pro peptidase family protein n=1 Tax=Perspicuibacillus lycopersici TaxID=1325689 RepID=A0AAE3LTL7_9BACI|nr:Xaa-Pro peptidase family protein [Perspicuibacillus lycopersici]MCU9614203.1 Xaa-Pro peptidase family protein [Perspicuibacillus lycopersici]